MIKKPYVSYCVNCGKELHLEKRKRVLCPKCRKEKDEYSLGFTLIKKTILARDNYKCLCCLRNTNLIVHHIDRDKRNNRPDNLVTLCNQCHISLHKYYEDKPSVFTRDIKRRKFPKVEYGKYGVRLKYKN